jgi:YtkA-like
MRRGSAISFVAVLSLGLTACGGSDNKSAPDMTMAPPTDLEGAVGKVCSPFDTRTDVWTLPIAKMSANGSFAVSLLTSTKSPPLIGDLTSWTLQIADPQGAMVTGATITIKPWMPDMGHGTSAEALMTAGDTPGQYVIAPLYLFMAGYWTVTLTITSGTVTDTVVYSICLADF